MKKKLLVHSLSKYMGNRKSFLWVSMLLSAFSGIMSVAAFIFIWMIVKTLLFSAGVINSGIIRSNLIWAVCMILGSMLAYFLSLMISHLAAFRLEVNMRRQAMKKIINFPLGFFEKNSSGRIRKIIDDNAGITHTFVAHQLPDLAGTLIVPLTALVLIFSFNWQLGTASMIPVITAIIIMVYLMSGAGDKFRKQYMDSLESMSSEAVEYVRGIPVVKVFQQTVFSFKNFYESIVKYRKLVIRYTMIWQNPMSLYTVIIQSSAFFLIPLSVILISNYRDTVKVISDMFFFILITPVFATCIMKSMNLGQNMMMAKDAVKRMEELVSAENLKESSEPKEIKSYSVEFTNVVFSYPGSDINAVNKISFKVPEGQTCALVGASGGGKSTIAKLTARFWDVNSGEIKIGGVNIKDTAKKHLMDKIAFVFQNNKLFKRSVYENITYSRRVADKEEVNRAVDLSQSREIIDKLKDKLDTKIGKDGTYLSGGEQQRIAIARTILKDAPIVLLDEATAFSDPENEHLIQKAFSELMRGKTVIMIAHRLNSVVNADIILVVDKGRIAEQGTHSELIMKNGLYRKMWAEYEKSVQWSI